MPPEILETLQLHPHLDCAMCELDDLLCPTDTLYANVASLEEENDIVIEDNLNTCVKIGQDAHYNNLITQQMTHDLHLDMENYFYKDNALIIVEDNSLKRGVTHLFHDSPTTGHPRISKTIDLISKHY
jgi:hypothetical protein